MMPDLEREVADLAEKLETDREFDRVQETVRGGPPRKRSRAAAWAAFLGIGIPAGFTVLLGVLASRQVYVNPIVSFWSRPLADFVTLMVGLGAFVLSLVLLRRR